MESVGSYKLLKMIWEAIKKIYNTYNTFFFYLIYFFICLFQWKKKKINNGEELLTLTPHTYIFDWWHKKKHYDHIFGNDWYLVHNLKALINFIISSPLMNTLGAFEMFVLIFHTDFDELKIHKLLEWGPLYLFSSVTGFGLH